MKVGSPYYLSPERAKYYLTPIKDRESKWFNTKPKPASKFDDLWSIGILM